ncbi:MAG: hotdog domain-containing protein, partial [Pseudomonadota bacterium]
RLSLPAVTEKEANQTVLFMSIDKVKFRKPVVPGDQLILEMEALRTGSRVWKMAGKAFVQEDLVAEAELVATVG